MENILDWIGTKATKPISMFFKYDWKTNKVVRFDAGDFCTQITLQTLME